jgi:predicted nucleotidyltransferase
VIARLVESCTSDERVAAAFLGGARARGEDDEFSDIDVSVIVADDAYTEVTAGRDAFVRRFGEPLFLEDFGNEHLTFVIFADGTDLELHLLRKSDLRSILSGPHRVLLDKEGILEGMEFPLPELDREARTEELRKILFWFWHDVGHFTTAIGRGLLWWAAGQLEALRNYCVNLVRIGQDGAAEDEPYWKLDVEISTEPLDALRSTFVPVERDAMLRGGRDVVAFFRRTATAVAATNGLAYPTELDQLVSGHLDRPAPDPR